MSTFADDHSTRFILEEDAPLLANLAALWAVNPQLARKVEAAETLNCHANPAKSGAPTLAWKGSDGKLVQLHSRYDPADEARRLIDSFDTSGALLLFIHGLGLGYHVERLAERAGKEAAIFVFEPHIEIVRTALEQRNLSQLIQDGRVAIVTEPDKAALFAALMPHAAMTSLGTATLRHAPSMQIAQTEHAEFEQLVADFLAYAKTCVSTLVLNGRRTAENIIRNLPWYLSTPSLSRLAGAHKGTPAIIVSAGPSLRKNKHLLKDASERAVIIAVQTTLQPLLEMGVEPDFVTSLDYHDICTRFFEKLPAKLKTELVAEPKATDAIFNLMPGPISLLGNDLAESLLAEMNLNKARLPAGATVAHLAFYLAEHLGCDPIIFVGQDLGFSDGLCYSPGTSYEDVWRPELGRFCTVEMKQWEQIVRDRPILRRVPDHQGRPTYTEERLFTYLQHFERDFARTSSRVIDATEGGVLKRGAKVMTLQQALDEHCRSRLRGTNDVDSNKLEQSPDFQRAIDCLKTRIEESETIERISAETKPLLEEIRDHLDDQRRVNRAIARIDQLRVELHPIGKTYHLITQLTQQSEMQRFLNDRRIASDGIDGTELQRRQVNRDIDNVAAIESAAKLMQALLRDAVSRIEQFAQTRQRRAA